MSALGTALALLLAVARAILAWLAERPVRAAGKQAARIARQRDEASQAAPSPRDLLKRMRDGRL